MALTLTGLIPTLMAATQKVSREQIGIIPAVSRNSKAVRAAVGQSVTSAVSPARTARNITAASSVPALGNVTYDTNTFSISKSRGIPVEWSGEEQMSVDAEGRPVNLILVNDFAQSMRTLANEIETDLGALYTKASRATGTSGTTPFASTLADAANAEKILDDNGAPSPMRFGILNSTAVVNLRGRATLNDPNQVVQDFVQQGNMINLAGISFKKSGSLASHTKGTGSGYLVDLGAGYAVGSTTIHVDTGTGTILAGDAITFAGDTNQYIVKTGFAGDGDGDIVLQEPGLRAALADNAALTITNSYSANLAFSQDAIELGVRLPAAPANGDGAVDVTTISDPVSGLIFEVREYRVYRAVVYEVGIAWGVNAANPRHLAIIKG